jgi:hypothetical protein
MRAQTNKAPDRGQTDPMYVDLLSLSSDRYLALLGASFILFRGFAFML